jgi:hypothetical protein
MSSYIDTESMEWPLHIADLELRFGLEIPNTIQPLFILPQEGAIIGQVYVRKDPVKINEQWTIGWDIRDKTFEELQLEKLEEEKLWPARLI